MKTSFISQKSKSQKLFEGDADSAKNSKKQIIAGLEGMKPGFLMQTIADRLGSSSAGFLAKHLFKILVKAVKHGAIKASALKNSIKDFGDKNIEDNSHIDWDNIEIDPNGTMLKCLFDGESRKIIGIANMR